MKRESISRRQFFNNIAMTAFALYVSGCGGYKKSVTKYHEDGTPYTVEEDDPVAALAAVVLLIIVIAIVAGVDAANDDDDTSRNIDNNELDLNGNRRKFQFVSNNISSVHNNEKLCITDSNGNLLAVADGSENIEHGNLKVIESLLKSAEISDIKKPVNINLKKGNSGAYEIENIQSLKISSSGQYLVIRRNIDGKLYNIKVFPCSDDVVNIEIEPLISVNQNVA
ncbi:MAG: hypothetical protein JXA96_06980 [Sedimentisphaerales bacterium]|nr:hypothetical protein [Sedimentisphaerales bacterium]